MTKLTKRCRWCGEDPVYVAYHDREWGVPLHDDRALFEFLILEGAQAGLSWITILRKREHYRAAFDGFDPAKVARYDQRKLASLLNDAGIVRNRLKVESAVINAKRLLALQEKFAPDGKDGGFNAYLWRWVDGKPQHNTWRGQHQLPTQTPLSLALSKDLTARGFKFVGPTICYSLMQAVGMVNDHLVDCFRHRELRTNP
ncbi:MAG: DNA-3-methyladenine glycosylase I [Rhodocyclaceae bacterium]|nr:MAG: DNA-3-methyladenine glycosylase I [Rhodocyclaceae bacterium]